MRGADMGLQMLINRLDAEQGDTLNIDWGYPSKPIVHAACTPDTSDTPESICTDAGAEFAAPLPVDADRWCWPHSSAMTGREIDTFNTRLLHFGAKGQSDAAEVLADRLVLRDREVDDRRLCLECAYADLNHAGRLRCNNSKSARTVAGWRDAQLPEVLVNHLHRCDGYADHLRFNSQKASA